MTIETIPLSAIEPSKANPRTAFDASGIAGLAASIQTDGLLQNLVVAPMKGKGKQNRYRIISGERRYRALQLLIKQGHLQDGHAVPVEIRRGLSRDDTLRLATVENLQRENLPPLDEADALTRLVQDGEKLDTLVAQTGLSERTIKRRLALNNLCDSACRALESGAISLAQAEALTLGDEDAQTRILERLIEGYHDTAEDIKHHLLDAKCPVAIAIFPRERYSGTYTRDLFADEATTYFDDVEQFFTLQREAVAELAERHAEHADWIEVTEEYRLQSWRYREAEEGEERGGVVINLSPTGKVEVREGLARRDIDARAGNTGEAVAPAKKVKPAYSATLCRDLAHHKSMAVQSLLLADRRKAREVAAVLMLGGSDTYDSPIRLRHHDCVQAFSRAEAPPAGYLDAEQRAQAFAGTLHLDGGPEDSAAWSRLLTGRKDAPGLYEAVKALDDEELDALLVLLPVLCFGQGNGERLDTEDSLFNRVARDLGADMRQHWQPDEDFLKRRTRDQLLQIAAASGLATHNAPKKKAELVKKLAGHFERARAAEAPTNVQQLARDWLPEAMHFPAVDPVAEATA